MPVNQFEARNNWSILREIIKPCNIHCTEIKTQRFYWNSQLSYHRTKSVEKHLVRIPSVCFCFSFFLRQKKDMLMLLTHAKCSSRAHARFVLLLYSINYLHWTASKAWAYLNAASVTSAYVCLSWTGLFKRSCAVVFSSEKSEGEIKKNQVKSFVVWKMNNEQFSRFSWRSSIEYFIQVKCVRDMYILLWRPK